MGINIMHDDFLEPAITATQTAEPEVLLVNDKLGDPAALGRSGAPTQPDIIPASDDPAGPVELAGAVVPAETAGTAAGTNDLPESVEPRRAEVSIAMAETEILPGEDFEEFCGLH